MKDNQMKPKRTQAVVKLLAVMVMLGFACGSAMAQYYRVLPYNPERAHRGETPDGLEMSKVFVPNEDNPREGILNLETYITGTVMTSTYGVPCDIVVIVDQSGSMAFDFDGNSTNNVNKKRITALKTALNNFLTQIKTDADDHGADHRVAIVGFAADNTSTNNRWENTELLTPSQIAYASGNNTTCRITDDQYRRALINIKNNQGNLNPTLTTAVNNIAASGGTCASWGFQMAMDVLDKRDVKTYTADGETKQRLQVVVFFTDGDPGRSVHDDYWEYQNGSYTNGYYADESVRIANQIKNGGAAIFTVGIFNGADPGGAYQTSYHSQYTTSQWVTRVACANGYMHFASSNFEASYFDNSNKPWSQHTRDAVNVAGFHNNGYYMASSNAAGLNQIFENISHSIGSATFPLSSTTIVKDVVSDYFQLPENYSSSDITAKVYGCIGGNSDDGWTFNTFPETLPLSASQSNDGVAIAALTPEVNATTNTVTITGFSFDDHWVGNLPDESGHDHFRGYKLVLSLPIVAKPGVWGDDLPTNEQTSVVAPGGEVSDIPFEVPHYSLKVETWIQAVASDPGTSHFEIVDNVAHLKSKQGLAWFISYATGYNGQDPHPTAQAVLDADVDMSEYNWVPIGGAVKGSQVVGGTGVPAYPSRVYGFQGVFDGNGHTITGLKNQAKVVQQPGMFGRVKGSTAEVKNVMVVDCDFITGKEGYFGIIADTVCGGAVIHDCEAAGWLHTHLANPHTVDPEYVSYDPQKSYLGGLVGLIGRDFGGTISPSSVHSSFSVALLEGFSMGGMVNEIATNVDVDNCSSLRNGYSDVAFYYHKPASAPSGSAILGVGGIVAKNDGKVENCYIRERGDVTVMDPNLAITPVEVTLKGIKAVATPAAKGTLYKGLVAGINNSSISNIYVPSEWSSETKWAGSSVTGATLAPLSTYTPAETPYMYGHNDTRVVTVNGKDATASRLLDKLNAWVTTSNGSTSTYTMWMRTTAGTNNSRGTNSNLNDDLPILKIAAFNAVAANSDGKVLHYGEANHLLGEFQASGDAIDIYKNTNISTTNASNVNVYINEDVALTQDVNLNAFVGITLDNSAGLGGANSTHPDPTYPYPDKDEIDWHMFATSLSDAPLGVNYNGDTQHWPFTYENTTMPEYRFYPETGTDAVDGYFPSHVYGTEYGTAGSDYYKYWDYYCWSEKDQHYINFKRNSNSHWKENNDGYGVSTVQIDYNNEEKLVPGKGYMLATAEPTFLQSHGTLNNGVVTNTGITYTENPFCVGYNLVGNPYQSYLDFDAFATENGVNTYSILNEDEGGYETYTKGATSGNRYINMHQGFFIEVPSGKNSVVFNNGMRAITTVSGYAPSAFRGEEQVSYPWVKITMTEQSGYRDYTTIEFDRPELGGGEKMMDLRLGDAIIYANYDGVGYSTFFATSDINSIPVRFVTVADGGFTLSWEMGNAKFGSIYLVDNINGQKIDMLSHNSYKFEGRASDYSSRFKIVFELTNTEEGDEEVAEDVNFAFQMDGNLVVNGLGHFEMFDNMGRLVLATDLYDTQNTIGVAQLAQGIYVLRLADEKNVKFQKIVVR